MLSLRPSRKIELKPSKIPGAGRGVFALGRFTKGEIIEHCPVLVMSSSDTQKLSRTKLRNYYFQWGDKPFAVALAFGYGELYNHSYRPNAMYVKHINDHYLEFVALKEIAIGEEITVNYHGDPNDKSPLWMNDVPGYEK